ncbi:MAG: TIGR03936 family radical SAM-associated protein, partial [Candidatus Zixiibacteriota bacterium]
SISVPSLRPGTISPSVLDAVKRVRKSGLTIAPEAGTERLRQFIRKGVTDQAIYDTARLAFEKGWTGIKLYFIIGLPTETDEDLDGIVNIIRNVYEIGREFQERKTVNVTLSPFVPEPHTSFQWDEIPSPEIIRQKITYIKKRCRKHDIHFKHDSVESAVLQGVLGRGGREMASVILAAYRAGCRFDGWSEEFAPDKWLTAFEQNGIDVSQKLRAIPFDAELPWSHIEKGASVEYLQRERQRSLSELKVAVPKLSGIIQDEQPNRQRAEFGRSKRKVASRSVASPIKNQVRIRWGKDARYKYMSHLDNIRLLERTFRRARIPVAYSQGFNPMMKLSFGPPLPLGFTSEAEYVDITLETNLTPPMVESIRKAMPEGVFLFEAKVILGSTPSLSSALNRVVYTLPLEGIGNQADLLDKISGILRADALPIERVGKSETTTVDVRPAIYDLTVDGDSLMMTLGLGDGGYVRPVEVLKLLKPEADWAVISHSFHRREIYRYEKDGRKTDPMDI